MVSFVASALSLAAFGAPDTATAEDLGYEVMVFLGVAIAISAVVTLIGAFWKDAIIAAFFEAAGLFGVWVPIGIYCVPIIRNVTNWSSGLGAISLVFILIACVWRFKQVIQWILWVYRDHPPEVWARVRGEPIEVIREPEGDHLE